MEADSTEQPSLTQEHKDLATLLLMIDEQASQDASPVMEADSTEQLSTTQNAATSKWAAANAKMMDIMAWIRKRSSKVNTECTEKQSGTLDSEEKSSKPMTDSSPVPAYDTSDDFLAVCDRKSEPLLDIDPRSCQKRKWSTKTKTEYHSNVTKKRRVIPREDPEKICHDNVDIFGLIHLDNLLKFSRSVSRDIPEVCGQDPTEDVPRNDCSAILSKKSITALLSESSPEVDTDLSQQPANMGEVKEFHLKEIKAYYWVKDRIWDPGIAIIKVRQT